MNRMGILATLPAFLATLSPAEVVRINKDNQNNKKLILTIERVTETAWLEEVQAGSVAAVDELIAAAHRNAGVPIPGPGYSYEAFASDDPDVYLPVLEDLGVLDSVEAAASPKKMAGDLAQTSVMGDPVAITAATTTGSAIITPTSMAGLQVGMIVTGPGIIAGGSPIIVKGSSTVTLNDNATATAAAAALVATPQEQVVGLGEWTLDWKRKTVDSTTTDDAEYEGALGSTKSWSAKSKYMFIDSDSSQEDAILAVLDLMETDTQTWNFFPTVESGRAAFQGDAIIDGITITSGLGKVVGLDVSLKGTGPLKKLTQRAPIASGTASGSQALV